MTIGYFRALGINPPETAARPYHPVDEVAFEMHLDRARFTPAEWKATGPIIDGSREEYTFEQATAGNQPALATGNFGDQVVFTGDQFMREPANGWGPNITDGTPFTLMADVDVQNPDQNRILFWFGEGSAGALVLRVGSGNVVEGYCGDGSTLVQGPAAAGDCIIEIHGDGTSVTVALDGVDGTSATRTTLGTLMNWTIGNHGLHTNAPWSGGIRNGLCFLANDEGLRNDARQWLAGQR